ncbi:AraC family transcriptional regulator [Saccharibacillus sacchari]|uniref:AraC family transcriptional regulator n=1 Tax=Saccharibacillus sacchari TaxID=456493 RepID=A0ACC6PII9_9BACL
MRTGISLPKSLLYGKLLITIVLCISITLLVSTFIYYTYYTGVEKNQVFASDVDNLSQTSREVINLNDISQSLSFQIYRNSMIANLLYYRQPSIYDVNASMIDLRNYLNAMPFIDSIYVYNSANRSFYVVSKTNEDGTFLTENMADQDVVERLERFKKLKPFVPIPRLLGEAETNVSPTPVYTFFLFDAINPEQKVDSAVVINISASWVNKEFSGFNPDSNSYILDDQGHLLSGSTLAEASLSSKEKSTLTAHIRNGNQGYYVDVVGGQSSLVSFTSKDSLGWQYVRITPYEQIISKTKSIRNMTLFFALLILFVGIFVSALLSRRLYRPFERMADEMKLLQSEKRDNMFTLRQNSLRDLILTDKNGVSSAKKERLLRLGISTDFDNGYRITVLRIDHYQELLSERGTSMASYKFAIMNIASEICGQDYLVEGVDMNDDSVVLLLAAKSDEPTVGDEHFQTLLLQCHEACGEYLKIGISSAYSPLSAQTDTPAGRYAEVRDASLYRFYAGHGSCISSAEIAALHRDDDYVYPADMEKKVTDALAAGKATEAAEVWYDIIIETQTYPYSALSLALSRLVVTIRSVSEQIRRHSALSLEGMSEIPNAADYETFEDLHYAYQEWFEEFSERLANKRSGKQSDLIHLIDKKIIGSYADPNLNLNQIADELEMSPVYISRLYKQQTSTTIMDVVMQMRLKEVCRLLEETNHSVSTIAEQTGFTSSSYLHRIFKRHFNVTPIEYRRTARI